MSFMITSYEDDLTKCMSKAFYTEAILCPDCWGPSFLDQATRFLQVSLFNCHVDFGAPVSSTLNERNFSLINRMLCFRSPLPN